MASSQIVFLMYHELELQGRALCQAEPGYVRYILPVENFRAQMIRMKDAGFRGVNVSEALQYPKESSVCVTFDDGCETDLIAAAPVLREVGFHATFYITAGFLDTPGYLSSGQLRELDGQGFELGCHSMTHPYLSDLPESELKREVGEAKLRIEQALGHLIEHFSCPGGRYDRRTLESARRAGFRSVANSRLHPNTATTSQYELGRVAILRTMSLDEFEAICQGRGLWNKRLQDTTRHTIRRMLGNRAYDRMRAALLGGAE